MNHAHLLKTFENLPFVNRSVELLKKNHNCNVKMLYGAAKSLYISAIAQRTQYKFLVLAPNSENAANLFDDMQLLMPQHNTWYFEPGKKQSSVKISNDPHIAELIDRVAKFQNEASAVAVCTPEILQMQIPNPDIVHQHACTLGKSQVVDIQELATQLSLNGFQKEQYVSRQGEYAVRGGIVDIFAPSMQLPVRIEFWDDSIDSIRFFDSLTQRSLEELDSIDFINSMFVSEEIASSTVFNYITQDTVFIIDEPQSIDFSQESLRPVSNFKCININSLGNADIELSCTPQPSMHASVQRFAMELDKNIKLNIGTYIAADGEIHLNRLKDLVENTLDVDDGIMNKNSSMFDMEQFDLKEIRFDINEVHWLASSLSTGFVLPEYQLAYFVENEIFARHRNIKSDKSKTAKGITLKELKQLHTGDYIVHEDKGIGKFDGFQSIEIAGSKQDCLRMVFADDDVLYVHLNYIHKVQKFSAADGTVPRLSKLGSTEWLRKKDRTKRKLKDIARELIALYAQRQMQKGFAFPPDGSWQKEFEAAFIYEDTIDQAKTTQEVKRDMEADMHMDRLVCGDVGFGKTEIAIRAAFKAATAGKQTAVLVPTTILAQQHYFSFSERIGRYPVKVDVLSRFRSRNDQKQILEKLKEGKIDILIGTHRILSKDIDFKDLGLLVVDEEHRFGVGAKEKLRQIKNNVDTLTLTATPIPRTLNFSLMGARDLSQIETPPRNRLPVITEINEWQDSFVCERILEEIRRGGQVFLVNDKIHGLDKIARDLQMEMPAIRFAEVHGQMPANFIEDIMDKFINRKFDVLLATKIIESGIDIPNANTIIINNAQNFGLAELYQLRGRVGRSNIQAYCYLLVPNASHLPAKALKRLLAIEEFTDLGSGLQLAMRDMEIRGAGALLGAEQSGFISEIGFDLYQKVLAEAVMELKKNEFADIFRKNDDEPDLPDFNNDDIMIETDTDAYFPPNYVEDDTERFSYYKALFEITTNNELKFIITELEDKYGKMPEEARELLFIVRLRIAALNTGFVRVTVKEDGMSLEFPPQENKEYYDKIFPVVLECAQAFEGMQLLQIKNKLTLKCDIERRSDVIDFLWKIKKTIEMSF